MPKLEEPEAAVAVPVWAWKLPVPINNKLTKASAALTTLYGEDVWMTQMGRHIIFFTPGKVCGCQRCNEYLERLVETTDRTAGEEHDWLEFTGGMIVCPTCGNKRCPKATHHIETCSGSNNPGQIGSSYA